MRDCDQKLRATRRDGVIRRAIGHFWTITPAIGQKIRPSGGPQCRPWRTTVPNEWGDEIIYTGQLTEVGDERQTLVVVLHGLGGTVDRGYCVSAATAARRRGLDCLRLSLRGADGVGADLHHAGFTDDLQPLLETSPLDEYDRVVLVGYSLGGHVGLRAAIDEAVDRLAAVVAICAPLDLKACQQAIDAPRAWLYRRYLLEGLKESYPSIAAGGRAPTPVERIEDVETLREWDALTVVPRFGFESVDQYYRSQSAGPRIQDVDVPSLVVASPGDPMVPADSLRGPLSRAPRRMDVRWVRDGGHVFFPPDATLGIGDEPGVENQIMAWVEETV